MAVSCVSAFAQLRTDSSRFIVQTLDDALFHDCGQVEKVARNAQIGVSGRAYQIQFAPRNGKVLVSPFLSEGTGWGAFKWVSTFRGKKLAQATLYFLDGASTFLCRDDQNHFVESAWPNEDAFKLTVLGGTAKIWHFHFSPVNAAHVYVVTSAPLESLRGGDLLSEVARRTGARFVYLYVRNDPWFFDYSPDSRPYIFADGFKSITEDEYRATRTLVCDSNEGCMLSQSQF